ncbi:hypothetical protein DERP_010933 [Dermatophagoides pteronyssinus]|uniref:Uncharacterized protein n=1 Tax=Dermatophagoides pteronyssinus TaxID=6956 RepID=A0ABQ8JUS7_DERPT|nr:hypothetical protein DERP_010933 [Dermatophagoides pteronyssinus]
MVVNIQKKERERLTGVNFSFSSIYATSGDRCSFGNILQKVTLPNFMNKFVTNVSEQLGDTLPIHNAFCPFEFGGLYEANKQIKKC